MKNSRQDMPITDNNNDDVKVPGTELRIPRHLFNQLVFEEENWELEVLLYEIALLVAREAEIQSLVVTIPREASGVFVCRATVTTRQGTIFQGIGTATMLNIPVQLMKSPLDVAALRAKRNALMDAYDVPHVIETLMASGAVTREM